MAIQRGTTARNAAIDSFETAVGTSPKLQLRSGAPPANPAAADSGALLAEITLPSDWMQAASGGVAAKSVAAWSGTGAAAGNIGHYRLKNNAGSVCHEQGTVTATGGGGDMTVDNIAIGVGQAVTVTTWQDTANNA